MTLKRPVCREKALHISGSARAEDSIKLKPAQPASLALRQFPQMPDLPAGLPRLT